MRACAREDVRLATTSAPRPRLQEPKRVGVSSTAVRVSARNSGTMQRRIAVVIVLGSPVYLLAFGPFGVFLVPVVTTAAGPWIWPGIARRRLAMLGATVTGTMIVVYFLAVFAFYGLGGPTGAWLWAGPLTGLLVYVVGCPYAIRRPWRWPVLVAVALLAIAAVGAVAMAIGVRFEA